MSDGRISIDLNDRIVTTMANRGKLCFIMIGMFFLFEIGAH